MIRKLKKYQQGGSFRDQLFPENKPIVDQGNFSKVNYTPAQKAAMQNANLVRKNEEKKKLQDEIAARQSKEKGTPYKLPTGVTKKYKDMTLKERAYVDAQSLRNKGRWNENSVEQPFLNMFNPLTMLYDMAAGLGEAPLTSNVSNSYMPYLTGVGVPLLTGALSGIGAKTTGQFVNNLANPLAGTGDLINNLGNKYLPNAYKYNPWAFKPNSKSYYRGLGRTGLDDAIESGVLRTANKTGNYAEDLYMTPNFNIAKGNYSIDQPTYKGNPFSDDWEKILPKDSKSYIAEIPKISLTNAKKIGRNVIVNKGYLPLDNIKLLKQDWLKGYKEIPKPKIYSKGQPTQQSILNNLNESFPKPLTSEQLDRFYKKYFPKLKETSQFIQEQGIRELKDFTSEEGQRRARLALLKLDPTLSETEINHLLKNQIIELENAYKYNMQEYMLRRPDKWMGNTDEHINFFNSNYPTNNAYAWRNPKFFTELTNNPGTIQNNVIPRVLYVDLPTSKIPKSNYYESHTFSSGARSMLDPNVTVPTISLGQRNKLKSTFDHETAHLLQRSGLHPTDIELQKLAQEGIFQKMWLKYKKKTMYPRDYNNSIDYFYNPGKDNPLRSYPNEGYPFAREARRSMIDKGILNNTFDKITPFKLLKHTLTKEVNDPIVGLANNKRLTTVFPFWKWGKLSKIMNNMNTVAPIIGGAGLLGAGALQQQKKGGPIITNRGQWDYPGQTTIIPSNQITMRGVPYPVLGVDNIGHSKLMQPGRNYTFPGQYVTEYPIMQKGGTKQNPPKVYTDKKKFEQAQRMYNDSLNLYKGMLMQDKLMGDNKKYGKPLLPKSNWTVENLKEARKRKIIKGLEKYGPIADDFQNEEEMFADNYFATTNDRKLIKYYKSLGFTDANIMYHSSADLVHPKIKAIGTYFDGYAQSPIYKKPVQPVVYQSNTSTLDEYSPIYVTNPTDQKPKILNHPIQKMNRLPMLPYLTEDSDVTINSGQFNVPAPVVQQPKGKPVYGPGNTIIGYNNNMHFTPAPQYTGAPNNASNLQDKALLENPNALRQYVSRLDNYRFDKGGIYSQALRGMYSQGLNNTINGLNQFSYLSKNSPDNAMRDYYMNMSNYESQNNNLYSTNQDLYGQNYFQDGGSYEELSNEYSDLREWQDLASMDGDNELYEYLTPDVNRLENSLKSMEDLARFDAMKEDLQRQIIQQPQYQEQSIEGYSPRRPYSNSSNTSEFLPMEFNQFQQVSSKPLKGVQQQVKSYLTQKGLSKNAIAGIMGNIEHESSFNPGIYGDQNKAFGLFQHHAQRKDNLLNFLQKRKLDKTSIEGQIDFALSEYPSLINKLNKAVSPQQAADIWVREFEKPANVEKQSKLRQRAALKYMKQGGTLPFFKQYK